MDCECICPDSNFRSVALASQKGLHLGICSVLEGIKDLFEGYDLASLLLNSFPYDAIGLCMRLFSAGPTRTTIYVRPCFMLTPLPSFCSMSYFLNTCLSISSLIAGMQTA